MTEREALQCAIAQGRGEEPADLVVRNVGLLDLISGDVTRTDVAISGDRIVGTYESYSGRREIDG
jgi:adenine deaminase